MNKNTREHVLLMPICLQSGNALLTSNNQVIRFDGKGNQQVHKLILATQQDKNWRVRVGGERADDEVRVSHIELIK